MAYERTDFSFLDGEAQSPSEQAHIALYGDAWNVNNSDFAEYSNGTWFPEHRGQYLNLWQVFAEYIEPSLDNVAIDIAGGTNGVAIQQLIEKQFVGRGLVTNLKDQRSPEALANSALSHVAGNILEPETWQQIVDWAMANAPDGVDIIIHRPKGGLQSMSRKFYKKAAMQLLDMLKPGGIFYAQVPDGLIHEELFGPPSKKVEKVCQAIIGTGIVSKVAYAGVNGYAWDRCVLFQKA